MHGQDQSSRFLSEALIGLMPPAKPPGRPPVPTTVAAVRAREQIERELLELLASAIEGLRAHEARIRELERDREFHRRRIGALERIQEVR